MNRFALAYRTMAAAILVACLSPNAAASDGNNRVLWGNVITGQYSLDVINNNNTVLSFANFGPYAGWTLQNIATGSDDTTRLLFQQRGVNSIPTGLASVVYVGAGGNFIGSTNVGPYPGWAPEFLAIGPDNVPRILWVNAQNVVSITWINPVMGGTATIAHSYNTGPFAGWELNGMDVGGDNVLRLIWAGSDKSVAVVLLDKNGNFVNSFSVPAVANMEPRGGAVGGDNHTRLAFASSDEHSVVIKIYNDAGVQVGATYSAGPYAGWQIAGGACGADNITRVAWLNTSTGTYSVHFLDAAGGFIYYRNIGPYTAWVPAGGSEPK